MEDNQITQKLSSLNPAETELEYYRKQFEDAGRIMLYNPSKENIKSFGDAQSKLLEIEEAYREGYRALLSRASQIRP